MEVAPVPWLRAGDALKAKKVPGLFFGSVRAKNKPGSFFAAGLAGHPAVCYQARMISRTVHTVVGAMILTLAFAPAAGAGGADTTGFRRIPVQFIAALGEPGAHAGNNAQEWGLWRVDPGPRGVPLISYDRLKQIGGTAPAGWKFDGTDWWLEEHGLIMEKPAFPLAPGRYLVTGDREVTTVLTVHPRDKDGHQRWELADGATLYDVTHLACRSARYTPISQNSCSPAKAPRSAFRVPPGQEMPPVEGCKKQDYAVLIVMAVADPDTNTTR